MTSPYATDAVILDQDRPYALKADKQGYPLQGQVPCKQVRITATGAFPTQCPSTIILSSASAITLTATSLANLAGRDVLIMSDGTNATAHVITLPTGSIIGGHTTATMSANASDFIHFRFVYSPTGTNGTFAALVLSSSGITLS